MHALSSFFVVAALLVAGASANAQTAAAPSALGNVYETIDWGQLTVTQWNANSFAARYTHEGGGQITARRDGLQIDGVWSQRTSAQRCDTQRGGSFHHGRMTFKFDRELGAFAGFWSYCDAAPDQTWNGNLANRGAGSSAASPAPAAVTIPQGPTALGNVYETVDWGQLTVTEWGANSFASRYTHEGGGRITARRDGLQIDGTWSQRTSAQRCDNQRGGSFYHGRMTFTFDRELAAFAGLWSYCDNPPDQTWNGNLVSRGTKSGKK